MNPAAHNKTPKRITLKKHESIVDVMQQKIDKLTLSLGATRERIKVKDALNDSLVAVNERERSIVNALIGHKEA